MSIPWRQHRGRSQPSILRRCLRSILYAYNHPSSSQWPPNFSDNLDNNFCGLNHPSDYNLATWDNWAKTKSANKNVKVYIGAPGSADAAGEGYVDAATLASFAKDAQNQFSSFGGVMLWDADSAFSMSHYVTLVFSYFVADIHAIANNRYDKAIKSALTANARALLPSSVASVKNQAHSTAHAAKPTSPSKASSTATSTIDNTKPSSTVNILKPVSTSTPPEDGSAKTHEILHKEPRTARINSRINSRFFRLWSLDMVDPTSH